ncbi:MAG: hypothetical protein JNM63_20065, partial [Spirochaetia bacterium]|nr:hypothetical protein [Spirochaetia bacterium]
MLLRQLFIWTTVAAIVLSALNAYFQHSMSSVFGSVLSLVFLILVFFRGISIPLLASVEACTHGILLLASVYEIHSPIWTMYVFWLIYFFANLLLIRHIVLLVFLYFFAFFPTISYLQTWYFHSSLALILCIVNGFGWRILQETIRKQELSRLNLQLGLDSITRQ